MGRLLSEQALRKARAREADTQRRIGWIFNLADVVLAPTTALPPPGVHDFDRRGGLSTDRAMIRACPVTWPWNLLGWPSINVPAGFTSDGLPIGVQLMGPADSEPMLVSLAAELEAMGNWSECAARACGGTSPTPSSDCLHARPVRPRVMSSTVNFSDAMPVLRRALPVLAVVGGAVVAMPSAHADNKRLNDGVVANVYTVQHQHGCTGRREDQPAVAAGCRVARQRRAQQPRARR